MSIDVLYTFAAILKEKISPFKVEILEALSETRTDKIKPVREASLEAL
jgi:late competence protein required for DNA uptake (superfamily II DNA/RNA helicase)